MAQTKLEAVLAKWPNIRALYQESTESVQKNLPFCQIAEMQMTTIQMIAKIADDEWLKNYDQKCQLLVGLMENLGKRN